mgnify:CR=1 FL=1
MGVPGGGPNPPNSSQGLDGHRTPMGLEGNETWEKIGEKIKIFESWEMIVNRLGDDGNMFSIYFLQFLQIFSRFSPDFRGLKKMTEG